MRIKDTNIIDYKLQRRQPSSNEVRTLYKGGFSCKGKPLDGQTFHQVSITKVIYKDEWGHKNWGEPTTTFTLDGELIPFANLEELISFYNNSVAMRKVILKGLEIEVSEDGNVVMYNGRRYKAHWVETSGRAYRLTIKQKVIYLHRLVAAAYLGHPKRKGMAVQYRDGDAHNVHHSNLYYSTKRCPAALQNQPDPTSERSRLGKNSLKKRK